MTGPGQPGGGARQARSTAKRLRSASEQYSRAPSCVARKTTRGACPASSASCQRGAQRHQRSPGLSPRNPNSGTGVDRSLPRDLENARNAAVMTAQTVWLPMSSRAVSQQPSRKNPVMGFTEQISSCSPSTLRGILRRPPPLPLSYLSIVASACGFLSTRTASWRPRDQHAGRRRPRVGDDGAVAAEMLARRAEQGFISDEALGVAAERQFAGGADGAVELDRLLVHEARAAPDLGFGAVDGARAHIRRPVEAQGRE